MGNGLLDILESQWGLPTKKQSKIKSNNIKNKPIKNTDNPLYEAMAGIVENDDSEDYKPSKSDIDNSSLSRQELKEKIRKLRIGNERDLGKLVSKDLVQAMIESIGQSIQSSFVDIPKRYAPVFAATFKIPANERDIEKMLSDIVETGIGSVIKNIEKQIAEDTFK